MNTSQLEYLNKYFIATLSLVGFSLNVLSYHVLNQKKFHSFQIYNYLRVYILNSTVICLIILSEFVLSSPSSNKCLEAYEAYVYQPVLTQTYFYAGVLDFFIGVGRLFCFMPSSSSINLLKKYSYRKICAYLFALCLFVNLPYFFVYMPSFHFIQGQIYLPKMSETYAILAIKDIIMLCAETFMNLSSILKLKKILSRKRKMICMSFGPNSRTIWNGLDNVVRCQNESGESEKRSLINLNRNRNIFFGRIKNNYRLMMISICSLSILAQFSVNLATMSYIFTQTHDQFGLSLVSKFFIALKHFFNFFILFSFNNLFKKEFKKMLK